MHICLCVCMRACVDACSLVIAPASRSKRCASHVGEWALLWMYPGIPTISCQIGLWALCALLSHGRGPHDGAQKHALNGNLLWEENRAGGPWEVAATARSPWVPQNPELDCQMWKRVNKHALHTDVGKVQAPWHFIWLLCLNCRLLNPDKLDPLPTESVLPPPPLEPEVCLLFFNHF